MYSSLFYDTSKKDDWSQIPFDILDFTLARHFLCNRVLEIPHSRRDYLRYSVFFKILEMKYWIMNLYRLFDFDDNDEKRIKQIEKYLENWLYEGVITRENLYYKLMRNTCLPGLEQKS